MPHQFNPQTDTALFRSPRVNAYYKPLDQPVYVVEPAARSPRATIIHIHGLCENAFRFFHTAQHWAHRGYQTVLFHLKAHGCRPEEAPHLHWLAGLYLTETDPSRILDQLARRPRVDSQRLQGIRSRNIEDMGTTTMEAHFNQLHAVAQQLGENQLPLFISGHSLGGLLACEGAYRLAQGLSTPPAGTILFSPALHPIARGTFNSIVLLSWKARHTPWLTPLTLALNSITGMNFRLPTGSSRNFVSDIPEQCRLHADDPLVLHTVRTAYLTRIEQQMVATLTRARHYPHNAIIFAAQHDSIVNTLGAQAFGKNLQTTRGLQHNPLVIYHDAFPHNPLRSTLTPPTLNRLDEWIGQQINLAPAR